MQTKNSYRAESWESVVGFLDTTDAVAIIGKDDRKAIKSRFSGYVCVCDCSETVWLLLRLLRLLPADADPDLQLTISLFIRYSLFCLSLHSNTCTQSISFTQVQRGVRGAIQRAAALQRHRFRFALAAAHSQRAAHCPNVRNVSSNLLQGRVLQSARQICQVQCPSAGGAAEQVL